MASYNLTCMDTKYGFSKSPESEDLWNIELDSRQCWTAYTKASYHPLTGRIRNKESNPIAPWKMFPPVEFIQSDAQVELNSKEEKG